MNEFYLINNIWIGSYEICATGSTPEEAIDIAWKTYVNNGFVAFSNKKEWLECHGIDEGSCRKCTIGEGWCE